MGFTQRRFPRDKLRSDSDVPKPYIGNPVSNVDLHVISVLYDRTRYAHARCRRHTRGSHGSAGRCLKMGIRLIS